MVQLPQDGRFGPVPRALDRTIKIGLRPFTCELSVSKVLQPDSPLSVD